MKTLIAYELKKLLNRRALWIALGLCAALLALGNAGDVVRALDGTIGGMREIYARYEGQVLTDALRAQILEDYQSYATAHTDQFQMSNSDMGYWPVMVQGRKGNHAYGVAQAYEKLYFLDTREMIEAKWQEAQTALSAGAAADGKVLTPEARRWYVLVTSRPPLVPFIHYDLGWTTDFTYDLDAAQWMTDMRMLGVFGMLLLLLLVLWGVPGFAGEHSAHQEPVLLAARLRRPAALAKALAAAGTGALAALLFCHVELAFKAVTLGLDGWSLQANNYGVGGTRLEAWMVSVLLTMLAGAACAALSTAATAVARGSLSALGLSVAVLAVQYGLQTAFVDVYYGWLMGQGSVSGAQVPLWMEIGNNVSSAFPVNQVLRQTMLLSNIPNTALLALSLAFSAALLALGLWLAPRVYLRRRRA